MSSSTLPKTMRAWVFSSRGLPRDVLSFDRSFPVPDPPAKDNLLIRISHVALNPGCYITMANIPPLVRRLLGGNTTAIAEAEFSGVVHLAGPSAPTGLCAGTRVFGNFPMMQLIAGAGALAEYIVVSASSVAVIPPSMGFVEASGLGGAAGDRLLVNGGSGGVGTMVIQIAKARGAYVIATCSGRNIDLVKSLGADEVIDYRANHPLPVYLAKEYHKRPFDFIFDTIGVQDLFTYSPHYLKPQGALINVGNFEGATLTVFRALLNTWRPVLLGGIPRRYSMISTTPDGVKAAQLARMTEEGQLRVIVDEVVEFEDVLRAYDRMINRSARGKIIVKVQDV
ncbi:NAD(P)-binding protein [Gymnopus androsaceus JB14]|uniref:NAD(P)-binding protein n=1 Tax=Gymnopus androsaceus JB14 TaxID=1447944 RepID=A0A6A4GWF8_9AGAR|nr:NAD(P)-binding protein [Gymnopus androsaceus JB14]